MNTGEQIAYDFILSFLGISIIILALILFLFCRKKPVQSEETLSSVSIKASAPIYPLTDIDVATDSFNPRRIIGKGRLGTVYAGVLSNQEIVAVKRIHSSLVLSNAGFGFSTILKTLSLAQHPNIVSILGFSQAPGERIIIMEFVGMASLEFYLHDNSDGGSLLDWSRRIRIAAGAARGLLYLHENMAPNVIHGCFKTSNILLDVKFCARVCDYGLYFLVPINEKRGLIGYVDDEFWSRNCSGGACKASDIYGFGVVLLEILTGKRCEEGLLVKWAIPLIKEMKFNEVLDPKLALPSNMNQVIRLAKVASSCVSNSRKNRPTIVEVAAILNNLEDEVCI